VISKICGRLEKWFWKGCKPNSVCALASGENHLSVQPIPGTRFTFAKPRAGRSGVPYLALHPMGFSVPRRLRFARCALTAPFHPCSFEISNLESQTGGLIFCGTVRRKIFQLSARVYLNRYGLELRGIAPFGVRTFLYRLAPEAILRPSKTAGNINDLGNNLKTRIPVRAASNHEFALTFVVSNE